MSLEAASFYEAVILYVTALNDAIKLGYSTKDGRIIHGLMRNRTLPGKNLSTCGYGVLDSCDVISSRLHYPRIFDSPVEFSETTDGWFAIVVSFSGGEDELLRRFRCTLFVLGIVGNFSVDGNNDR